MRAACCCCCGQCCCCCCFCFFSRSSWTAMVSSLSLVFFSYTLYRFVSIRFFLLLLLAYSLWFTIHNSSFSANLSTREPKIQSNLCFHWKLHIEHTNLQKSTSLCRLLFEWPFFLWLCSALLILWWTEQQEEKKTTHSTVQRQRYRGFESQMITKKRGTHQQTNGGHRKNMAS